MVRGENEILKITKVWVQKEKKGEEEEEEAGMNENIEIGR